MTPEDIERLEELEELFEDEELTKEDNEDEWEELKDLRAERRQENRDSKALAKFDKARTVYRVSTPVMRLREGVTWDSHYASGNGDADFVPTGEVEIYYVLEMAVAKILAQDTSTIEEISRQSLTGSYSVISAFPPAEGGAFDAYAEDDGE